MAMQKESVTQSRYVIACLKTGRVQRHTGLEELCGSSYAPVSPAVRIMAVRCTLVAQAPGSDPCGQQAGERGEAESGTPAEAPTSACAIILGQGVESFAGIAIFRIVI
jgi:hypothetical protein